MRSHANAQNFIFKRSSTSIRNDAGGSMRKITHRAKCRGDPCGRPVPLLAPVYTTLPVGACAKLPKCGKKNVGATLAVALFPALAPIASSAHQISYSHLIQQLYW